MQAPVGHSNPDLAMDYYLAGSYDDEFRSTVMYSNPDSDGFVMDAWLGVTSDECAPVELLDRVAAFLSKHSGNESIVLRIDDPDIAREAQKYTLYLGIIPCIEILSIDGVNNRDRFCTLCGGTR